MMGVLQKRGRNSSAKPSPAAVALRALALLVVVSLLPPIPIVSAQLSTPTARDTTLVGSVTKGAAYTQSPYAVLDMLMVGEHPTQDQKFRPLIRFDLSSIPLNAVVTSAKLELFHRSTLGSGSADIALFEVLQTWQEPGAFADIYDGLNVWQSTLANGIQDRTQTPIARAAVSSSTLNRFVSWSLSPELIERWLANPAANTGLILIDTREQNVLSQFYSSNNPDPTLRPKLTITYTHGPKTTVALQPGSEGVDTHIRTGISSTNPSNFDNYFSIAVGEHPKVNFRYRGLIKFDLSRIPADALVNSAKLELFAHGADPPSFSPRSASVYEALKPWTESGAFEDVYDGTNPWAVPLAGGQGTDRSSQPLATATVTQDQLARWNLDPALVQLWLSAPGSNNGLLIADDIENAVVYGFYSSDSVNAGRRPRLTVTYTRRPTVTTIIQPAGSQAPVQNVAKTSIYYPDGTLARCGATETLAGFTAADAPVCAVREGLFCRADQAAWSGESSGPFSAAQRSTLKSAQLVGSGTSSCCPSDACWDGTRCVANMASDPTLPPINDHRCVNGEWVFSPLAFTWDRAESGFCPTLSQCLVDLQGDPALNNQPDQWLLGKTPQCISSGQFILDHYCSQKTWTTRTKLLALALLDLMNQTADTRERYSLICDAFNSSLVDTEYGSVLDVLQGPRQGAFRAPCTPARGEHCVNNFCVLEYRDRFAGKRKHVAAVSLNTPISDPQRSFLLALDKLPTYCSTRSGSDDTAFQRCSDDARIWFNPSLNAVVFSNDAVSLEGPSAVQRFTEWFEAPIRSVLDWITGYHPPSQIQPDYSFVQQAAQFGKLYVSAAAGRHIYAVQEDVGQKSFIAARYEGFAADLCAYVNNKALVKGINQDVTKADLVCSAAGSTYSVFTGDRNALQLWPELTARLRLS